jgi:hypothetical protein
MMSDSRPKDAPDAAADKPVADERQKDFTRRALIRAGWMMPVVTAINIPEASAQTPTPHNDAHGDSGHQDQSIIHLDVHLDTPGEVHQDHTDNAHTDHSDVPHADHSDVPHADHSDVPHTDHADAPHTDAPHTDHADVPHADHADVPHTDHADIPHTDAPHSDHADTPHNDHADSRTATPI